MSTLSAHNLTFTKLYSDSDSSESESEMARLREAAVDAPTVVHDLNYR